MKKIIQLLVFIVSSTMLIGQNIDSIYTTVPFYFEDGVGNKDTVELIFSEQYIFESHPQHFEQDLIEEPFDSTFEVRITTDEYRGDNNFQPFFLLRKMGLTYVDDHPQIPNQGYCLWGGEYPHFIINLKHLPLTVRWDSEMFREGNPLGCVDGSYLINHTQYNLSAFWEDLIAQGSMFDAACLAGEGEKVFTLSPDHPQSAYPQFEFGAYALHHIEGSANVFDTLSVFPLFFAFDFQTHCDTPVSTSEQSTQDRDRVKIYPNPASDRVAIQYLGSEKITEVSIFTTDGRLLTSVSAREISDIDVSKLRKGIYYLRMMTGGGQLVTRKFIKE